MASRFDLEIELKSSAEEFWKNLREFVTFYPKALPHMYESFEVLEGDGKSVGSILLSHFKFGISEGSNSATSKEKLIILDDETKTLGEEVLEGDVLKSCKSFKDLYTVVSKDEGSLLKYSAIYDKINEETTDLEVVLRESIFQFFQDLDAYIIKTRN